MLNLVSKKINSAMDLVSKSFLAPEKPSPYFLASAEKFTERLVYESSFIDEDRYIFLLSDGALGTFFEFTHIPHEIES